MARARVHKQGSLDGLCGLYSITNAFTRLADELDPDDVFRQAALGVGRKAYPDVLWDGLDIDQLLPSTKKVARWAADRHDVKISVSLPFAKRRFQKTSDFLDELAALIGDRPGLAIISVEWGKSRGGEGHWLVYQSHESSCLKVLDSNGPGSMKSRSLSVKGTRGNCIIEQETILIMRDQAEA